MGLISLTSFIGSFGILFWQARGMKYKIIFLKYVIRNILGRVFPALRREEDWYIEFKDANLWFGASSGELSSLIEIFVRKDYELDPDFIPTDGETVFDIGANIGVYTIRQAKRMKNGRIFCFEPNPYAYSRLQKNLQANHLQNVISFDTALYSQKCRLPLNFDLNATGRSELNNGAGKYSSTLSVQTTTMDNMVEAYNIEKIDLVKIDVEGSEFEVLKGANKGLRNTDKIVMECHSKELKTLIETFLEYRGFEKTLEIVGKPLFTLYFRKI